MILFCFNKIYKMTQYDTLNVKLSNSQLNKLKSAIKNGTKVTLNLSLNIVRIQQFPYVAYVRTYA